MTAIDKVIEIAENEVGYLEKASNSSLYDKTANAGTENYTKYWAEIKPDYQGQPWCACFVTWCFVQAFGKETAEKLLKHYPYVYCPKMAEFFGLNANPKRGDIVIFYRKGTFTHTGIVTSVDGDHFETVEGNTSGGSSIIANGGGVCKKSYYNSNLPGTKFCRPDYDIITESEEIDMEELAAVKAEIAAVRAKYDTIIDKMGAELEALRKADEPMIYNYIDDNMPQWAHEGVQWCVDNGIIQGTGEGLGLDDKDLKYCTIIKRLAEMLKV
jgi:hypothetical protein